MELPGQASPQPFRQILLDTDESYHQLQRSFVLGCIAFAEVLYSAIEDSELSPR